MLFYTLGVGEYTASLVCYVFFVHYFLSLIPALFQVYPRPCIKYASTELGVSNSLIQRILNEPKWHATTVHYMISTNKEHRVTLCSMVLKTCRRRLKKNINCADTSKFTRVIIFSKNCHFWGNNSPNVK